MLEKVMENWTSRLDYIRANRGSHMPEIIFKIRVVKVSDLDMPCHEFKPSTTKDPPCKGATNVNSFERSNGLPLSVAEFDRPTKNDGIRQYGDVKSAKYWGFKPFLVGEHRDYRGRWERDEPDEISG
ncbi:hypothetical protein TNCV_3333531 [Trichonephila clavipes]|nr:hypothetical protein TNCV_3333531 [Trichonephila clavipes]